MKIDVPAITDKTKRKMSSVLEEHFQYHEEDSLQGVVSEVLNDKDLFIYLATLLADGCGLYLSTMSLPRREGDINMHYGLTLKLDGGPRKTALFFYEEQNGKKYEIRKTHGFQEYPLSQSMPTSESHLIIPSSLEFSEQVNRILQNPTVYHVDLKKDPIIIPKIEVTAT